MRSKTLRISIVIPAYNEQSHIEACLRAIANQQKKPFEVIVVNNGSTDRTAEIAKQFPDVSVINEDKGGVVHARDRGFNYARGDVIGRIDADTLLPSDWTLKLEKIFQDKTIKAVSGSIHFYDIGCSRIVDAGDSLFRGWMARRMVANGRIFLLGANMAIRRSAWKAVRGHVCQREGMHEDLDLSLHMSEAKQSVVYSPELLANLSARRIDTNIFSFTKYAFLSPLTYYRHNAKEHRYMYPLIMAVIINFVILKLLFRAFDTSSRSLSIKLLFNHVSVARVNPATYL